jgi:uncharacterized protein (DUF433 family)
MGDLNMAVEAPMGKIPLPPENPLLGVGLYTLADAARLLRLDRAKLSRWARGYQASANPKEGARPPVIQRSVAERAGESILTFYELVELNLVAMFRTAGVSMPTIRRAREKLSERLGTSHPLAMSRVRTDGTRLLLEIARGETGRIYEELTSEAQTVMGDLAEPFFKNLEYDEEMARRYWPLGKEKGIVLDPRRSFGAPIDDRTGVPTHPLYAMVRGGTSVKQVADWYQVPESTVKAACEFEEWLSPDEQLIWFIRRRGVFIQTALASLPGTAFDVTMGGKAVPIRRR